MSGPLLSCNKAREVLGRMKGLKKIDHNTLTRLVKKEGLPKHEDPFGSGRWCFLESELEAWFQACLEKRSPNASRRNHAQ